MPVLTGRLRMRARKPDSATRKKIRAAKNFPDLRIYNKEGNFEKYLLMSQEPRAKSQEILPGDVMFVKSQLH
jgi:hypothetical protein